MTIGTINNQKEMHRIYRHGKRLDQGGHGVTWSCSCGHGKCYAMVSLFRGYLDLSLIKFTVNGKRIFASRLAAEVKKVQQPRVKPQKQQLLFAV